MRGIEASRARQRRATGSIPLSPPAAPGPRPAPGRAAAAPPPRPGATWSSSGAACGRPSKGTPGLSITLPTKR